MKKEQFLKKLGKRIRDLRIEKKISQAELANSINKDQQSVQRLEAGNINPSIYYLQEIASGLDVSIEILLKNL